MAAKLALEGIDKRYGAVHAVRAVSVSFEAGRIHVVAGENGAGKSTLLKVAAGLVTPDAGRVLVDGTPLAPHSPREAIARGVGMVQQHFALVGALTALENVVLGAEPVASFGRVDRAAALAQAKAAARDLGVELPWDARVETLGVGDRQRLEIVRTLVRKARVVILDEPTAVLTPGEARALYATLRTLADAGRAVVVVTHRLDEVRDHADDVTVLRRGALVSSRRVAERDAEAVKSLAREIMGEEPPPEVDRAAAPAGDAPVRLALRDVVLGRALRGVRLSVRAGEIVGVAGVEGNGQRELVRVLAGLEVVDGGTVQAERVQVVHEDRHAEGLVLTASVEDNLVLGELPSFTSRLGIVDPASLRREATTRLEASHVVPADLDVHAGALSGGNQQKIVVGRAVAREGGCDAFVFAQPTRGVDVGAARAIHGEIARMAAAGKAVLVVSADLGELRALCGRLVVMSRGRIVAELPPDASDEAVGEAMLGGPVQESA